ncbi:MAG TPA: superoxide dismutase [Ferruginibacter sp.]|nr:superoxide dismutase [Ferruginibacter sp.]HRN79413.1 superoxide dismutase [Ferruginibacter sp.]HRO17383.1 superoxide dismutase [Ferruginibacter sp.]HRQ21081.1 superoxide dismutase [Ferruginibacter sp.]
MAQQPLPYAFSALEDVIDTQTMDIHYNRHAAGYSKNLIEAASAEGVSSETSMEDLLPNISRYTTKMRNNAGGHYNHELFWKCMRPKREQNAPTGTLLAAIENTFGSFEQFKLQFANAASGRFGSGWAWLYMNNAKTLMIGSTPNQDNPLMNVSEIKGTPLLGLDVWEHAYYLKYQNKRADYIAHWWKVVNWDYVSQRYTALMS